MSEANLEPHGLRIRVTLTLRIGPATVLRKGRPRRWLTLLPLGILDPDLLLFHPVAGQWLRLLTDKPFGLDLTNAP